MLLLAPNFFLNVRSSGSELAALESAGVLSRGVGALETLESVPSSSSAPKESLPFAATLRFFLKTGLGVDALYL